MNNQDVRAITPDDTFQDQRGGLWRMPQGGRPYFDSKRTSQGAWVAVLWCLNPANPKDRVVMTLNRSTPVELVRVAGSAS